MPVSSLVMTVSQISEELKLPQGPPSDRESGDGGGGIRIEDFSNTSLDPMATVEREEIGLFGMKIDREMYRERFAEQACNAVTTDAVLRQAYEDEDWAAVEERVRGLLFEKPEEFWDLPKLQELYKTDRLPSLREILARVFGLIPTIPSRSQLADEAFERFITTQQTNATHSRELRTVFVAFLLDTQSRLLLEEGRFAELRAHDASLFGSLSHLSPPERQALIGYLQSQVPIKEFEIVA